MKKRFLSLLLLPLMLIGCTNNNPNSDKGSYEHNSISKAVHTGEIGDFKLTGPEDGFITDTGFTFTWEEANNADNYQIEIASTLSFVTDDEDEVYVKENNLSSNQYALNFNLPKKDILYYWRVTAVNVDHTKKSDVGNFYVASPKIDEIPIKIEDEQDWVLHKEGSYADIKIDRSDFFGTGHDSLAIVFDKEHTLQGKPSSDGWIVITKSEDRELYGTDSFYFNFYYSGHDASVLVRVLDYDGEYWHKQVQISNNAKQTVLMRYEDFELRTAGTNIFNRKFDWQHIRYFEIVFERTFGDGICLFSNIKAVKFNDYKNMFMDKMDFRNEMAISEDGSELTLNFTAKNAETNPNGFSGYGFQNVNVYKYFIEGDAVRMKVKYTGASSNSNFYFRILEEDNDRWQFKLSFNYLIRDDYKELVIPLKAFQRTDYMTGDGAKQFYYIQKFNIGLADNYSTGSLSIKDLEVIKIDDIVENRKRIVSNDGCIDNFNDYGIYTEMYYYWDQSVVNKDEAMKLDTIHKAGGSTNTYCAEFDYKADMEMATYQIYLDTKNVDPNLNAFSIWLKDASVKFDDPAVAYLDEKDIAAEMTIQLTMDTGEWYRYIIPEVGKEWQQYILAFDDMMVKDEAGNVTHNGWFLENERSLFDEPKPLSRISGTIKEDTDNPNRITIETMEGYANNADIFEYWSYATERDYNEMALATDVSSIGGAKSLRMHYKGYESISYSRATQFANTITAKGFSIDVKGDGKATVYLNLNWRSGTTLMKMRVMITAIVISIILSLRRFLFRAPLMYQCL